MAGELASSAAPRCNLRAGPWSTNARDAYVLRDTAGDHERAHIHSTAIRPTHSDD
jgi:hypothetical protein